MNGELGTLFQQGRQVGGFFDWHIDVAVLESTSRQHREFVIGNCKATAQRFWMLEWPNGNAMEARFYFYRNGALLLCNVNDVILVLPEGYELNKVIERRVVMTWTK